jgi:phosphatidylglycerophosphatase A
MKPFKINKAPSSIWRNPVHFLAFGFGSGASPFLPGTVGSLMALPFYWVLQYLPPLQYALVVVVGFAVGVLICDKTSRDLGVEDHGGIVWDEIIGMWATLFLAPAGWLPMIIGFLLFRVFDIVKPWPVSLADKKVKGGFGVMLDDLLAAVYAGVALHLVLYFLK